MPPVRDTPRACTGGACASSTRVEPDWTGRCRCRQTFGSRASPPGIASSTWRGCGTGKPDALDAVHVVYRFEEAREVARGVVGRLVVVDDLAEQLDFPASASPPPRAPPRGCRPWAASARGRACTGTTQKLQNSLQPSMMVTYALIGSLRRVTPSGNVTSSYGLRSSSGAGRAACRAADACSTSIGSRRIACVPTMTIGDAGRSLEERRALLLGHAAGDGDNGIVPARRRAARSSPRRV